MIKLTELLGAEFKPTANVEGFEILNGTYKVKLSTLRPGTNKDSNEVDHYYVEWEVLETLKGTNAAAGRKPFRKRYYRDNGDDMKKLLNDLFTVGINLVAHDSWEAFEAQFPIAIGATGTIRAWGWEPEKDLAGATIPEEDRIARQMFKVVKIKNISSKDLPF